MGPFPACLGRPCAHGHNEGKSRAPSYSSLTPAYFFSVIPTGPLLHQLPMPFSLHYSPTPPLEAFPYCVVPQPHSFCIDACLPICSDPPYPFYIRLHLQRSSFLGSSTIHEYLNYTGDVPNLSHLTKVPLVFSSSQKLSLPPHSPKVYGPPAQTPQQGL